MSEMTKKSGLRTLELPPNFCSCRAKKKLSYAHAQGLYEVNLSNAPSGSSDDENLSVQIIVSTPDKETARP
jgi:hypothetical protein